MAILRTDYVTFQDVPAVAMNTTNAEVNVATAKLDNSVRNVRDFGAVGDGITDDSAAIAAAVAELNSNSKTSGLYFPGSTGPYLIGAGHTFTKTVHIFGDSPDASNIKVKDGSLGDVFTFNGRSSTFEKIGGDGNKDGYVLAPDGVTRVYTSGDFLVFNAGYPVVELVLIANAAGTAIRIGKAARAIIARLEKVMTRTSRDYGIWVQQDSTDGQWTKVDVGTAGLSGIRIESSSQSGAKVHAWGCGTRKVAGDASGFLITSSGHQFGSPQGESNWEYGMSFMDNNQNGSQLGEPKMWANGLAGINVERYSRLRVSTWTCYDNGLRNGATADNNWVATGESADAKYAGIRNVESNHIKVTGGDAYDREGARSFDTPSPKMSRPANVITQTGGYVEDGTTASSLGAITGNGLLGTGAVRMMGNGNEFYGNRTDSSVLNVALSGNGIPIRSNHTIVNVSLPVTDPVTTTGNFNSLGTDSRAGRIITLMFSATGISIFENGNIKLIGGAFGSAAGRQITFQFNGTKWVELSRV